VSRRTGAAAADRSGLSEEDFVAMTFTTSLRAQRLVRRSLGEGGSNPSIRYAAPWIFAEPVIRRRFAPTGWLAMTALSEGGNNAISDGGDACGMDGLVHRSRCDLGQSN